MIFVGEHTSYTHAWIAAAVESGVRGSVQLLLGEFVASIFRHSMSNAGHSELGLVDEAKEAVNKWMARWIDIVSVAILPSAAAASQSLTPN